MTNRKYTNRKYLDQIEQKVIVFDGAMGTSLQLQQLTAENFGGEALNGCNDHLVISYPQAVEKVHRSFLDVGVDVIETDTFRSNRLTLKEYNLQDQVNEINMAAAGLARRLADEYTQTTGQARFVAGSIGPSGKLPSADDPELSNIGFDELVEVFKEQSAALAIGGADFIIIETSQDILEVKAAILGCQLGFESCGIYLPVQAQVTLDTSGRMLLGTDIATALTILEGLPIDVIGLNCSTGPDHMREPIRQLGEQAALPVSCIPNAGLPLNVDGQAVYPLEPEPFASALVEFVDKYKISVVGGCCGTTPAHLKTLIEKLNGRAHPQRPSSPLARLSSSISPTMMQQEPAPLLIGERCNAQGSRKFKRHLLEEDYDSILEVARDQVNFGAHALDISCAVTERADEVELMRKTVKKLSMGVEVPLVIDTTEFDVLETALKTAPGRCLINSTHLESGRAKADRIFALAKTHNAAVIVLTIDENGMAKTADAKLEVAKRIYDIAVNEHGLRPADLVFDDLTFTLATGDPEFSNSAIETINGIRAIKQNLPGVFTSLGVSNLSFGLAPQARPPLNSVMLFHCVQAGLDMAIINPAHVTPYADLPQQEIAICEDLIFNRRADALQRLIEYYENISPQSADQNKIDPTIGMTAEQRIHWRIVHRHKDGVESDIDEIILSVPDSHIRQVQNETAVRTLNQVLLPAMKEVGDKFGAGELILPFVLQSAEVMKKSVSHLEKYLDKVEGITKGTVVIATVYGDVHDIGKNLVKTILANNGYTVVDLGKQVPADKIIAAAKQNNATAIGLSALLVSTSKQMPLIVNELHRQGLNIPVLIGGAAINRKFGRRILFTENGDAYKAGVFYCKDAFEGLETMDRLIDPTQKQAFLDSSKKEAEDELGRAAAKVSASPTGQRSTVTPKPITAPSKWGVRVVKNMPLQTVFQHLNINELYRLSWGAKNTHGEEWVKLQADFDRRLESMKKEAIKDGWLAPQGVFGIFPCQSTGNELLVYEPDSLSGTPKVKTTFNFPRQNSDQFLSLADYFASVDSGVMDVVAFQVVTVGQTASDRFDALQTNGNYTEAYFTHGLAVQTAEAAADFMHNFVRKELGIPPGQGKRYSWGYPAIPELEDHQKVFDMLPAQAELGMQLSPAYQLLPEQSTAAIVIHHPEARYYTTGESRTDQLMK